MMLFNQHFHFSKLHTPAAFELVIEKIRPYWTAQSQILIYLEDMQHAKVSGLDRIVREHPPLKPHITECLYTHQDGTTQPMRYIGNLQGNYEQVQQTFRVELSMVRAIVSGIPSRYPLEYASVHVTCLNFNHSNESQLSNEQIQIHSYNHQIRNKFCSFGSDKTVGSMIKFHSDYWPSRRSTWCEVMILKDKLSNHENPLPAEIATKVQGQWHSLRRKLIDMDEYLSENHDAMDKEAKFSQDSEGRRTYHDFRLPFA